MSHSMIILCKYELSYHEIHIGWTSSYKNIKRKTYLKMEISQSQEWLGKAMKIHTAANNHTAETIPIVILETFWLPRCTKPSRKVKFNTWISNQITKIKSSHHYNKRRYDLKWGRVNHLRHRLQFGTR